MASNDLRLQVILQAIDRVTAPLRRIKSAGDPTAESVKVARAELKRRVRQRSCTACRAASPPQSTLRSDPWYRSSLMPWPMSRTAAGCTWINPDCLERFPAGSPNEKAPHLKDAGLFGSFPD
jgi:hypothetical protein